VFGRRTKRKRRQHNRQHTRFFGQLTCFQQEILSEPGVEPHRKVGSLLFGAPERDEGNRTPIRRFPYLLERHRLEPHKTSIAVSMGLDHT
jgi:hypothetical protein